MDEDCACKIQRNHCPAPFAKRASKAFPNRSLYGELIPEAMELRAQVCTGKERLRYPIPEMIFSFIQITLKES
jgi:hypothetical protein